MENIIKYQVALLIKKNSQKVLLRHRYYKGCQITSLFMFVLDSEFSHNNTIICF